LGEDFVLVPVWLPIQIGQDEPNLDAWSVETPSIKVESTVRAPAWVSLVEIKLLNDGFPVSILA